MEKPLNMKAIEKQVKELTENLWKIQKSLELQYDDFFLYNTMKNLEERINVIETILKIDQDNI